MHKIYKIQKGQEVTSGRFFWEESSRPEEEKGICFIPNSLIENGKLNRKLYIDQNWARTNCASQIKKVGFPQGVGSHMFPDLKKPVLEKNPEQELIKERIEGFLKRWK